MYVCVCVCVCCVCVCVWPLKWCSIEWSTLRVFLEVKLRAVVEDYKVDSPEVQVFVFSGCR